MGSLPEKGSAERGMKEKQEKKVGFSESQTSSILNISDADSRPARQSCAKLWSILICVSLIIGILIAIVYFETIELNIDTKKYLDKDITSTINDDFDAFKNLLIQLNDSICIDKDHPDYQYCQHIQNEIIN